MIKVPKKLKRAIASRIFNELPRELREAKKGAFKIKIRKYLMIRSIGFVYS